MKLKEYNNRIIKLGIHFFIWAILLLFPYLLSPLQKNSFNMMLLHAWLPLFLYAIIFYLNYFLLLNWFLFERKYVSYCLINAILIFICVWFNWQARNLFMNIDMYGMYLPNNMGNNIQNELFKPKGTPPPNNFFILKDLFSFFIPIIFSIAVKATENWIKTEAEKKEIENKNLESELQHLRYQLQPHFFFNSLNNIYSLVEVSPTKAQEAIHNLSKLMRYLLYETTREKVELADEISFLKKYIQLMEIRQTDKTKTYYVFPETENTSYRIAPLLFIPMIENAYKHGVSATQNSRISFGMTIKDNQLLFSSENSNFPKSTSDKSGSGIGLDNLKKRLELLYNNKYELRKGLRDNTFWITLRIELD